MLAVQNSQEDQLKRYFRKKKNGPMFYIFVRIHSIQTVDDVISAETERSMSLIITAPTLRSLSHGDAQLLLI